MPHQKLTIDEYRIIGSEFEQALIGVFAFPIVTPNGFGVERYLEYTVSPPITSVGSHGPGSWPLLRFLNILYIV